MSRRPSPRARELELPATADLPVYLTSLVGRDREVAEVAGLLRAGRLVTLVGAGGSGKTRLAAAVAAELRDRQGAAVGWIDFGALSEPALVARHAAAALGLREQPGRAALDALVGLIGPAPALLALDNCEHLLGACTVLADALLRGCPALRILATSRQALGVAGEKAWLVPPLALPADGDERAAESGAVQLFVQRASDALPTFALTEANAPAVVRICRRLDGLPLAIELAAARVRLLPPEQLAGRLDGVFGLLASSSRVALPRHRTLRALIDWSYDLLSPPERLLFARLAAFAGGFTLDAAEHVVAGEGLPCEEVLDVLAALVDRSLVSMREWHGEARYGLLETVRQYARERLQAEGDGAERLRRRHAEHFAGVAEHAAPQLHRHAQLEWLARLDAEHDNLRAALAWSVGAGDAELALRLCLALRDYWRMRGHLGEARRWNEEALRLPAGERCALRARAVVWAAVFGRMQGDHQGFLARLEESGALARENGDRAALADALTQLGVNLRDRHELDEARARLDEAVALWRTLGDPWGLTLALCARATTALAMGEAPLARALREEAVEVSRRVGDREGQARGLIGLGEIARREGDLAGARACYERCLPCFREFGDTWHMAAVHQNLGWVELDAGRPREAYAAFCEAVDLFGRAGAPFGLTLCLAGFAGVLHAGGDPASAAEALAAAFRDAERVQMRPVPADADAWERARAAAEGALAPEEAARARARGEAMEPAECLAWVREKLETAYPDCGCASPFCAPAAAAAAPRPGPAPTPAARPAELRVRALGPLQVFLGERPLEGEAFGSSKPRELLLMLLCHPDGCTREQVGLAFWPESSAAQVKNSFHVTLHRLRRALERPEWIAAAGDRYRLDPDLAVEFDARLFQAGVEAALRRTGAGAAAADALAEALALYRGDFLEGEVVGDWHLDVRDRLRRLYVDGQLARGRLLMAAERFAAAAEAFRAVLARDRLHEEAYRQLMTCHARTGERVQALRLYENLAVLLQDELGAAPGPDTCALYERLQRAEPV